MERKGIRSRSPSDKEQKEDRRIGLRKKKIVRYFRDDDEEEHEDEEEDKDEEEYKDEEKDKEEEEEEEDDQEDYKQPGAAHIQRERENRLWSVKCGNKKGILHVDKFEMGEQCIESESCWFIPCHFENFGGKAYCRKWKQSIYYKKRPLQFWLDEGVLTTEGFISKGSETKKQNKSRSRNRVSVSSSKELEKESSEEDNVKNNDRSPGSRELALDIEEDEEDKEPAENGGEVVNSADDKSQEEEMEDEERRKKLITSAPEKRASVRGVKVVIKRLPEAMRDCQSNDMEHPPEGSWCEPLNDEQSEEQREDSGSEIDDPFDSSQTSAKTINGDVTEENGEEVTKSNEIKTQTPLCAPASSVPDTTPEIQVRTEVAGSTSNHTANLSASPVLMVTQGTGNQFRDVQRWIKEESKEAMSVLVDVKHQNTDAASSGHDAAQLPVMTFETWVPQSSESPQPSNMDEHPVSISSNLDTVDLDQLKREKIKMQLKVLKLQDEYYTLKLKRLKK